MNREQFRISLRKNDDILYSLTKFNVNAFQDDLGCIYSDDGYYYSGSDYWNCLYIKDYNYRQTFGERFPWTPIQYCSAIENGHNQVKLLLENKADPYLKDKTGRDALDIARVTGRKETIQVLEEFYSKNQ